MRIAIICPKEPQLIGPGGLLASVLALLAATSPDVYVVVPAGSVQQLLHNVKTVRVDKFAQRAKRYDGIFYHIAPDADENDWICQLAKQVPGVAVLLEETGHRCLIDEALLTGSRAVLTFSHEARRKLWKEWPHLDVRVIGGTGEAPHAELYRQLLGETDSMRRWLRRQVGQSIAREIAAFGLVPDVTEATLRRFSEEIRAIL